MKFAVTSLLYAASVFCAVGCSGGTSSPAAQAPASQPPLNPAQSGPNFNAVTASDVNPFDQYAGTYKVVSEHRFEKSNQNDKVTDQDVIPVYTNRIRIKTGIGKDQTGTEFGFLFGDQGDGGWSYGFYPHVSNAWPGGDKAYYEAGPNSALAHNYLRFLAGCPDHAIYEIHQQDGKLIFTDDYGVDAKPGDCEPGSIVTLPYKSQNKRTYVIEKLP